MLGFVPETKEFSKGKSPMKQNDIRVTRDQLESLREFDAPLIANTLDYFDDSPPHERYMSGEIQSVTPTLNPIVGVAFTAQFDTSTPGNTPDMALYWDQIAEMEALDAPAIWVVETVGSRPDFECVLGDGTAKVLYAAGCLGCVTSGYVRDVPGLLTVPFAVHCRGTIAHHCALNMKAINVPVSVGGLTIEPGDLIHACQDGVIKIPPPSIPMLLEKAPLHRMVEGETHLIWRRTDLTFEEKKEHATAVYKRHGFT